MVPIKSLPHLLPILVVVGIVGGFVEGRSADFVIGIVSGLLYAWFLAAKYPALRQRLSAGHETPVSGHSVSGQTSSTLHTSGLKIAGPDPSFQIHANVAHPANSKRSAEGIGAVLAGCYHSAFGADIFHNYFDGASFGSQNIDIALAEWHAFGTFSYTFCLWKAFNDQDAVFPILDVFQPNLLNTLRLNESARAGFLKIVTQRQDEYLSRYQEISDSPSMSRFYGRVVAHITGKFAAALDEMGVPQLADVATASALCHFHTTVMIRTKDLVEKLRQ